MSLRDAKEVAVSPEVDEHQDIDVLTSLIRADRAAVIAEAKRVLCPGTVRAPLHEAPCVGGCGYTCWLPEGETIGWCHHVICLPAALDAILKEKE